MRAILPVKEVGKWTRNDKTPEEQTMLMKKHLQLISAHSLYS